MDWSGVMLAVMLMSSNNYDYDPSLVQRFLSEYQDRSMLKWQGFYLSDHTAKLNQDQEQAKARLQHQHLASAQMSEAQITQIINQVVMKHLTVKVEPAIVNSDLIANYCIQGKIMGCFQDYIIIGKQLIKISDIYSIKIAEPKN